MAKRWQCTQELEAWAESAGFRVGPLAERLGVSTRTLERDFAAAFGMTVRDWLLTTKMNKAKELLRKNEPIKSISCQLGYQHVSNFRREFKQHYGYPARQGRASL